jgi:hypothetical protein
MTHSSQSLEIQPYFDLELIMSMGQETRLGGAVTDRLMRLWEQWIPEAHALHVKTDSMDCLAVWLNATVEEEVDRAWDESPSDAYLYNTLAQVLCMSTVYGILPEVQEAGCAPAPHVTDTLRAALIAEGLPYTPSGTPARRYAVVTHYPFKGGCEICNLQQACPKAQGAGEAASILLPGYERGQA